MSDVEMMATKTTRATELQACLDDLNHARTRLYELLTSEHGIQQLDQKQVGDIADAICNQVGSLARYAAHLSDYATGSMSSTSAANATERDTSPRLPRHKRRVGADGIARPTWDRWDNEETELRVRELYAAGESLRSIAKIVGCSHGTVHRIVRKLGL